MGMIVLRAQVMRGLCRGLCGRGYAGMVKWGDYPGGHAGYIPIGKLRSIRLPFLCPHCRRSDTRGHTETRLGVSPLKKH